MLQIIRNKNKPIIESIGEKLKNNICFKNIKTKIIEVIISTNGYCQEIFVLQPLHLLFKKIKEKTGINSCQFNFLLQLKQPDLPVIPLPVFNLKITTFKKLPIINPNIKKKNIPK